jgi:hypothetical protein
MLILRHSHLLSQLLSSAALPGPRYCTAHNISIVYVLLFAYFIYALYTCYTLVLTLTLARGSLECHSHTVYIRNLQQAMCMSCCKQRGCTMCTSCLLCHCSTAAYCVCSMKRMSTLQAPCELLRNLLHIAYVLSCAYIMCCCCCCLRVLQAGAVAVPALRAALQKVSVTLV